jgi:hypothetical protein
MSMIQNLKNNMMQQPMQPQQAQQPQLNPQQQQMVAGLQKQKANLQNQYNSASKGASFFSNASQGIMDSPKDESFLASLARGINAGTQGLEGHRASQEKNLEKQTMIDQAIAQTYQFVEDYNYKREMDKEKIAIEREKIAATREGHYLSANANIHGHDAALQGKQMDAQAKGQKERIKSVEKFQTAYGYSKDMVKELELAEKLVSQMNDYGPVMGKLDKAGLTAFALATGNDPSKVEVVAKVLNNVLVKAMAVTKTGGRMTNDILNTLRSSKPSFGMGKNALLEVIDQMKKEGLGVMEQSRFIMEQVENGVDPSVAELQFDDFKERNRRGETGGGMQNTQTQKQNPIMNNQGSGAGVQQNQENIPNENENDLMNRAMKDILNP